MTTLHSGDTDCPIALLLSIRSARLRSLILKKHSKTLNAQLKTDKKADPHLTRMTLLNMFQIFQITQINFDQYLQIHKHPDTYSTQRDATTQTEHTTIKPKHLVRSLSNRMRSEMEKQRLNSYWPSDNNDDTDEELQKDPPEALDDNYLYKSYTYVSFSYQQMTSTALVHPHLQIQHPQRLLVTAQHPFLTTSPPPNS